MTPDKLRALSIAAAKAVMVEPYRTVLIGEEDSGCEYCNGYIPVCDDIWLHEDSARCFELAVEHGIEPLIRNGIVYVKLHNWMFADPLVNHNNDKLQATRVAILRALVARKGE